MSEWTRIGDKCNKEFFEFCNGPQKSTPIRELINNDQVLTEQKEMQQYVDNYYKQLYSRDETVEAADQARMNCFASVPTCVTEEQGRKLMKPPPPRK